MHPSFREKFSNFTLNVQNLDTMTLISDDCAVLEDLSTPLEAVKTYISTDESVPLLRCKVPDLCKSQECIIGIDEAGRGPVLGPMVYGICYCVKKNEEVLKTLGCADSKTLTEEKREDIFKKICAEPESLGWAVDIISPNRISNCMLRKQKFSLNEISHTSAIDLIKLLEKEKVNVSEVYVDTVGPAEKYEDKLSKIFPHIKIKVSKKADSLFPVVSAASICAKVIRDLALKNWIFPENIKMNEETGWGSGYPGDPVTKQFLSDNLDSVFGFPQIVRFSWSTADTILQESAVPVAWSDDEEDTDKTNTTITSFFKPPNKIQKHSFFSDRNLESAEFL